MTNDPIERLTPAKLKSVPDWEEAIAKTIAADEMLDWFDEVLQAHIRDLEAGGSVRPEYLQLFCGAHIRFQELAHFSRKLSPVERQAFKAQATDIIKLITKLWGKNAEVMRPLEAAVAASADRYKKFGWPSPLWNIIDFEEL